MKLTDEECQVLVEMLLSIHHALSTADWTPQSRDDFADVMVELARYFGDFGVVTHVLWQCVTMLKTGRGPTQEELDACIPAEYACPSDDGEEFVEKLREYVALLNAPGLPQ